MDYYKWKKYKKSGSYWRQLQRNRKFIFKSPKTMELVSPDNRCPVTLKSPVKTSLQQQDLGSDSEINIKTNEEVRNNWFVELENDDDIDDKCKSAGNDTGDLQEELRKWAIIYNIKQNALKPLLQLINKHLVLKLPVDPRTLLLTPTSKDIILEKIGESGLYWHQGLEFCLKNHFSSINRSMTISINISCDGLPIYKSSKDELWPILFNIHELQSFQPMVIGVFSGKSKPSSAKEYLQCLVKELKSLMENGVTINEHTIHISLRCFIADSPARAFIKGVANFNGQHGCLKCTTIGEYSYISHTNIFARKDCPLRNDAGFRNRLYGSHHKYDTPLEELPIDMIEAFPVSDSLHLIDLGIVKRLLMGWRDGSLSYSVKWPSRDITRISKLLLNCKMPLEIHRSVRGLECLAFWKGLEYRTFLLYVGIVILKDNVAYDIYEHFLLLFCAVTICSTSKYFNLLLVARELFKYFIEKYIEIYGEHYKTSNVHNLIHVVDEVQKFGALSTISSYPFENMLFQIKRKLRSGRLPLSQLARRLIESTLSNKEINSKIFPILKKPNAGENIMIDFPDDTEFFYQIELNGFTLGNDNANKWFLTNANEIVGVENIIQSEELLIYGSSLKNTENFFKTPIQSSYLHIFASDCEQNESKLYRVNEIKSKLVAVTRDENLTVFLPLIHTLK